MVIDSMYIYVHRTSYQYVLVLCTRTMYYVHTCRCMIYIVAPTFCSSTRTMYEQGAPWYTVRDVLLCTMYLVYIVALLFVQVASHLVGLCTLYDVYVIVLCIAASTTCILPRTR